MMQPHSPRSVFGRDQASEDELAYEYGLTRLRMASVQKGPAIYESYAGVLSPRTNGVPTLPNPIYENRALTGAVSRLRSAARSSSPRTREVTTAYTLAAEEQQKAMKKAEAEALDRRRHTVVSQIYTLHRSHVDLLRAARRVKKEAVIPPAPQAVAAAAKAIHDAMAWGLPADGYRPEPPPSAKGSLPAGAFGTPRGGRVSQQQQQQRPHDRSHWRNPSGSRASSAGRSRSPPRWQCCADGGGFGASMSSSSYGMPGGHVGASILAAGDLRARSPFDPSMALPAAGVAPYPEPPRTAPEGGSRHRPGTAPSHPAPQHSGGNGGSLSARPSSSHAASSGGGTATHAPAAAPAPASAAAARRQQQQQMGAQSWESWEAPPEDAPFAAFSSGAPCEAGPATAATKERRRKQQMRAKARRILREAVRIKQLEADVAAHAGSPSPKQKRGGSPSRSSSPGEAPGEGGGEGEGGGGGAGGLTLASASHMRRMVKVALGIQKAADALRQSELLADLGDRQLSMMASAGKRRSHKRYTGVYREGSIASSFYVLTAGTVKESSVSGVSRTITCERRPNAPYLLFGMEALLGRPRASTIVCGTDVELIKFPAVELNIREDGAAQVARKVFDAFVQSELQSMSLFKGVTQRQLKSVAQLLQLEEHPAGTKLFAMGNPGDKVYIIMHGAVSIYKGKQLVQRLQAEQGQAATSEMGLPVFGEMALIDRKPRVASAVCDTDSKLLVLPNDQFASCMMTVPDIKARLRRMKEMRRAQNELDEKRRKAALEDPDTADKAIKAEEEEDHGVDVDM